jgi:hypothetical protein
MGLLEDGAWQGKLWTGEWTDGSGGTYSAVEPATGETLGEVGKATAEDVHTAALHAVQAQRAWAALPFEERARVLRRAGEVLEANGEEIKSCCAPARRGCPSPAAYRPASSGSSPRSTCRRSWPSGPSPRHWRWATRSS